jgi:hypothetical protein
MRTRLISVAVAAMAGAMAHASVTLQFTDAISGAPVGGPVFATLTIQNAGANTVNFTMTNTMDGNVSGGQFISGLLLNVDPYVAGTMNWTSNRITGYEFDMDGENSSGGKFDYSVDFVTANNGNRFVAGNVVTWSVTGSGLSEDDFTGMSAGNNSYQAMIHIQSIPNSGGSAKVTPGAPVPEPATLMALGLGLTALLRRRKA